MGTPPKKTELLSFFEKAKELVVGGKEIDTKFLQNQFKLTEYGASCLSYMLRVGQYFPVLEDIYTQDNPANLNKKKNEMIRFLDNIPPYEKNSIYDEEISSKDKEIYLTTGIARKVPLEEYRQEIIQIYIGINQLVEDHTKHMREQLNLKYAPYFKFYFRGKKKEYVIGNLERSGFKESEIKTILKLLSTKGPSHKKVNIENLNSALKNNTLTTKNEFRTILYDCDCHLFEEVIQQIIKAVGCTYRKASHLANIAHHTGEVVICTGSKNYCKKISDTLRNAELETAIIK